MQTPRLDPLKFLQTIQPFKSLSPEDLKKISSRTETESFSKEESIFNEGDEANSVWVLYQGRVRIFKYTREGRPFAIESLGPGELFGTLCRLGGNGRNYPCTAIAAEPTIVLKMQDQVFLEYYMKSPGMVRGICSLCSDRLKDVQDLRCMGQESVSVRIAAILLRLSQVHGETIPFTKKEVSELVGTTLETTFRTLSDFQKQGLLSSSRMKIHVKNQQKLKEFVQKI